MRQRYRIAHVITRLDLGGAQENTLYCVRHHARSRFDVELIAGAGGELDSEAGRIPEARVQLAPYLRHEIAPAADVLALLRLVRHFSKARVDLVHTHSSKAGLLGRLAARLAGVPAVVHTVHGWSFNRTQPSAVQTAFVGLERAVAPLADRLVVVSEHDAREGRSRHIGRPDQYTLVRSGIDAAAYGVAPADRESVRRSLGIEPHHVLVGTLACLKPQKAPLDFVRAAAAARTHHPELRFVVAGDGPLREAASREIAELGLAGIVQLLGWRRDVAALLGAMDVFLLTSRFEGLPRAVLQAMAAGVPVVATAVNGTPEAVRDRASGLLVPPEAPERAAEAVIELVRDPGLRARCIAGGRAALGDGFDIRRMVHRLEEIYISLLSASHGADGRSAGAGAPWPEETA